MHAIIEPTDDELVARVKSSSRDDLRAFEALVRRHQTNVMTNCRYLTGSVDDAEDLAQDVFTKAFFGLKKFEGRSPFGTWLKRIKVNHCFNYLKQRARRGQPTSFDDEDERSGAAEPAVEPQAEARVLLLDTREQIGRVLDEMPEDLRVALLLRDFDGLSYQEVAEQLGIGLSAVKMRIKHGRSDFRARFVAARNGEQTA